MSVVRWSMILLIFTATASAKDLTFQKANLKFGVADSCKVQISDRGTMAMCGEKMKLNAMVVPFAEVRPQLEALAKNPQMPSAQGVEEFKTPAGHKGLRIAFGKKGEKTGKAGVVMAIQGKDGQGLLIMLMGKDDLKDVRPWMEWTQAIVKSIANI